MELYECVKAFPQQYFVEEEHFSVTANLFTFKFVMDKVGPFNEKLKSSGDVEWGQRVYAAGYGLRYANDVCVLHPARYSLRDYSQKAFRVIDGFRVMHPRSRFLKELLREMLPPFPDAFRIWKNRRLFGVKQRLMAIAVLFYARYLKVYYRIRVLIRPPGKWEARV
jgi:GT2 family glycosyltransferase